MKEAIIRTIVFFVLLTVIVLSIVGTWQVITLDVQKNGNPLNTMITETNTGAGYMSIIIDSEENKYNE